MTERQRRIDTLAIVLRNIGLELQGLRLELDSLTELAHGSRLQFKPLQQEGLIK